MKCDRCGVEVNEPFTLRSMQLCEDCYMDLLSPMKSCDPWAVHSARISMNQGRQALLPIQQQILDAVTAAGAMTVTDLSEALGIPPAELERHFATLRHMELLRGFKGDDGKKRLCPFDRP